MIKTFFRFRAVNQTHPRMNFFHPFAIQATLCFADNNAPWTSRICYSFVLKSSCLFFSILTTFSNENPTPSTHNISTYNGKLVVTCIQ